jgi:carbonic anhydrase
MRISLLILLIALLSCKQSNKHQEKKTFAPIEKLKAGNTRFAQGHPLHPDATRKRIRELKKGQIPHTIVVSCSDSRVPPELIFDQGFGNIFSIRTAGNIIGDYELGSIEYAVEHFNCNLVVVMGHESCGAIEAYLKADHLHPHSDHIGKIVEYITNEAEEKALPDSVHNNIDFAVRANISHGVNLLRSSMPVLKPLADKHKISIIGALYDLDTGKVSFLD